MRIAILAKAMMEYECDCIPRINHFLKVWSYARTIAGLEGLTGESLEVLEAAALVHDIGIRPSLEKYGSAAGPHQEKEGPPLAEDMLARLGFAPGVAQRAAALVGRHHTYTGIDGPDCQILIEADFFVNIDEGKMPLERVREVRESIFRTKAGLELLNLVYINE